MADAAGFTFDVRSSGDIVVRHEGRLATTLRGAAAVKFLDDVAAGRNEQELLARLTGNYKRGNEKRSL